MAGLSIRARLTAWTGLVLGLILVGLGLAVYVEMRHTLSERIDASLAFEFEETAEEVCSGRLGRGRIDRPEAFLEVYLFRVEAPPGRLVVESPELRGLPLRPAPNEGRQFSTEPMGRLGPHRVVSGRVCGREGPRSLWIARSLDDFDRELAELQTALWTILPAGLVAAVSAGYVLAGRALSPVGRMAEAARRISASNLHERIETANPSDELGRLAGTLNAMLDRIDATFASLRRFTADASHELKTPITVIRTEAEVALRSERTAEALAEVLESVIEEADRLARLADRLLALSREDAGYEPHPKSVVRLDELVRSATERIQASARSEGLSVQVGPMPPVEVLADPDRLREVFDNLLDNARKYNRLGGSVLVRLQVRDRQAAAEVIDTGQGIGAEALPRIFDRFFREEASRNRRSGGAGLGLSIVKAIVEAHHGRIEVESLPGSGCTFRVLLPVVRTL